MVIFRRGGFCLSFGGGTGFRYIPRLLDDEPGDAIPTLGPGSEALLVAVAERLTPFPRMSVITEYLRSPAG
jgi:hypothetical protein